MPGSVAEQAGTMLTRLVDETRRDLRHGARALARTPGFVVVSIFTLAIAIAIGTLAFTAMNAFFYRPLAVPEGDRLVTVFTGDFSGREKRGGSSWADLDDFARELDPMAELAGESRVMLGIGMDGDASLLQGALVSSNYFRMLRVAPEIGRFPSGPMAEAPEVVLSHTLWRRAFATDTSVIGRQVRLNGQPFTVAAVAPPAFRGTSRESAVDLWIDAEFAPLVLPGDDVLRNRDNRSVHLTGRLAEGASVEALHSRLPIVAARLSQEYPDEWRDTTGNARSVTVMREQDVVASSIPRAELLLLIAGVVTFGFGLLAIASTNLASMQMARGASRRREIATRLALGAGRGRLVRQLLAEAASIALPGIAAGVLLALGGSTIVSRYLPIAMPSLDFALDWRALAFIAGALLIALLVFGLVPALQAVRPDVLTDLKGGDRPGPGGLRVGGVRGALIVAQVALSVVFTASAGLVAFALLRQANQGSSDAREVLITRVDFLPTAGDARQVSAIVADALDAIAATPGVRAASAAAFIPVRGTRMSVMAETRSGAGDAKQRELDANFVMPGYFDVLGIPVLRGRDFSSGDLAPGSRVALVSRAMAEALWPGEDAMGKTMMVESGGGASLTEVIGVVADPVGFVPATDRSYPGLVYLPLRPGREARVIFHVRAPTDQDAIGTRVAQQFNRYGDRLVAPRSMSLEAFRHRAMTPQRIMARAAAAIATVQLLLAMAGLWGLIAYVTELRRHEIGIRTALGASRGSVLALVMRQGIRLTIFGGAVGLALSLAVAGIIADMLTVTPGITVSGLLLAVLIFAVVGAMAMLLPARRALDVVPAAALRAD